MQIYEWLTPDGRQLFIIATLADYSRRYIAPLSKEGRAATGKNTMTAEWISELGASEHVPKFETFEAAQAALPAARAVKLD